MNKRIAEIKRQEREMLREHGWLMHHVFETSAHEFGGLANQHTHGLEENYGHKDFQMVLPIDPRITHSLFKTIAERIKAGDEFIEGKEYNNIIQNFNVHFKEVTENDRTVLRLILPDENGKTPTDKDCKKPYNRQYETLNDCI